MPSRLEALRKGVQVKGVVPHQLVTIADVEWSGTDAVTVIYVRADGKTDRDLLYRTDELRLEVIENQRLWAFDAHGSLIRLVSEAYRIHLAYLFDPLLAVHLSLIEPLPHQITAVYDEMLTRHPLRFLLADDPGAGKTIMAGLLIRELIVRGDVRRCLICAPGSLVEQWQDELGAKFQLEFTIMTRDLLEASRTGNPFAEHDLIIIRLDQLTRGDDLQARLAQTDWDLIVCDEAHKMSATFSWGDLKETKRYQLGKLLSRVTRHFLLMTATPHNGKEEDFQLFLALLDADRFEGRFRDGVHELDVSDLMRRMVKERLLKFDGKPLFPERKAYTVNYHLSPEEQALYEDVTEYVRQEFNRAEQLESEGRKGTIGFALTILQRRLASSPEAIYQSLKRRRERLENRLKEARQTQERQLKMGDFLDDDDLDDLDDAPDVEVMQIEAQLVDNATAAQTIDELETEIMSLRELEAKALRVRRGGNDKKWAELSHLLQTAPEIQSASGVGRKLVIFTEHRDTLNYLHDQLKTLIGRDEAILIIHGGIRRDERRETEDRFRNDPEALILLATDAAGEGINLQRAHLMVNYDLPWNPNRLEQRFGRIHRIGQTEVCHLWNLVAGGTREGAVYQRLLEKIRAEQNALNGQVFDVLGKLFQDTPLRDLLIEAVRYGDDPQVRARLEQAVDNVTDQERLRTLLEQQSLVTNTMDVSQIIHIREEMERASIRRLQPFYIKAFFMMAFSYFEGKIYEREPNRYTINNVPAVIRNHAKKMGLGAISVSYERICFEKSLIQVPNKPPATLICPGHPLLDALLNLILMRERDTLKRGGILIDESDPSQDPRVLFYVEGAIQDALPNKMGERRVISREIHFLEVNSNSEIREAGGAPYLDYRPTDESELSQLTHLFDQAWLQGENLERLVTSYAIQHIIPDHLGRIRTRRIDLINKTEQAVKDRLGKEINYWDYRAGELKKAEKEGKPNAKLNSQRAQERADKLAERLSQRLAELAQERQISASPPIITGGVLIIPIGMILGANTPTDVIDRRITENIAMRAVMETEIRLGHFPRDVSAQNKGYDIESRDGRTGKTRFIEVKGRKQGAESLTLTYNEIRCALNSPNQFILAIVEVAQGKAQSPRYVWGYPFTEPPLNAISINFNMKDFLALSQEPE